MQIWIEERRKKLGRQKGGRLVGKERRKKAGTEKGVERSRIEEGRKKE